MPAGIGEKGPEAFRTIGEVAAELGIAQHILRYWETKFPQLRPLQRAGNRRHYRPQDVILVRRIHQLLTQEGYTVRGVQQLLKNGQAPAEKKPAEKPDLRAMASELRRVRERLSAALD